MLKQAKREALERQAPPALARNRTPPVLPDRLVAVWTSSGNWGLSFSTQMGANIRKWAQINEVGKFNTDDHR